MTVHRYIIYTLLLITFTYSSTAANDKNSSTIKKNILLKNITLSFDEQLNAALNLLSKNIKTDNHASIAENYSTIGELYRNNNDYQHALKYDISALKYAHLADDSTIIGKFYTNLGADNYFLGEYTKATENYFAALKIYTAIDNQTKIIDSYNNIGEVYYRLRDYDYANNYFNKAIEKSKKLDYKTGLITGTNNLGRVFLSQKKYEEAIPYHKKAYELALEDNDEVLIARTLFYLGASNKYSGHLVEADKYSSQSLELYKKLNIKSGIQGLLNCLGYTCFLKKEYNRAAELLNEAEQLGMELKAKPRLQTTYRYLVELYSSQNKYKNALYFQKRLTRLKDSLVTLEAKNKIAELNTIYETEKKELENEHLKSMNASQLYSFAIIILLSMVLIIFTVKRYKDKEKDNTLLNELIHTRDKLYSIIAHDLKNPFFTILGNTQLLLENNNNLTSEEKLDSICSINRSAKYNYSLLENLLNWTKTKTNKISFTPQEVDLVKTIDDCKNYLSSIIAKKNLNIKVEVAPNFSIYADENMLYTIIRNLLSNAAKFSFSDSDIIIRASNTETHSKIEIEDFGVGIAEEDINLLLNENQIDSKPGTNQEKGSGLGFILIKEFVEKHGGKLEINSAPDSGSKFGLLFPLG